MWCCGLFFREPDFKIGLQAGFVHIHTGDENPLVNPNQQKSVGQKRYEQALEYYKGMFKNFGQFK